jgi:hypothetical protein
VVGEPADLRGNIPANLSRRVLICEKRDVLGPPQTDHHSQPGLRRFVEQPLRRCRVGANRIDAVPHHRGEVAGDDLARRELVPVRVRCERPVGDPFDPESLSVHTNELAVHLHRLVAIRNVFIVTRRLPRERITTRMYDWRHGMGANRTTAHMARPAQDRGQRT